ncbi:glycosyltransferase family 2 protein [Chloroflexota bacterium]
MTEWLIWTIIIICTGLCILALVLVVAKNKAGPESARTRQPKRIAESVIQCVTVIAVACTLYYLGWRLSTLNPDAMMLSWLLWAAEAYGLMVFMLYAFMAWRLVYPLPPKPRRSPIVDVLIPTYNEPVDVLRATLAGCAKIRYPHRTYVLDDGGREEVRALAATFNCGYIARPAHEGAKAGNLNYALRRTSGELIATLDADHIPLEGFLDETIGFFEDQTVAVVQGPQLFYNLDSFEHEGATWHEQKLFFHVILPGKNRTNSAFWCGTPSVLRRSAIESIGGIAEETVTEDLHTSIRLARRGYRVVYIDRPLASGLAPATPKDFLAQRFRWAQGAMQVLRKDNPLWGRGLTLGQRISFFASMETYFDSLQKLVLLAIPILVLLTGALPINTLSWSFWVRFTPYMILTFSALWLLGRGIYNIWDILRYDAIKMFTFTSALRTLITGRTRPFQVTSKVAGDGNRSPFQPLFTPHWIMMGLSFAAIAIGTVHLIHPIWYQPESFPMLIAIGWASFNLILLAAGVFRIRGVSRRTTYRFPVETDSYWQAIGDSSWYPARSVDFSAKGIGLENMGPRLRVGDRVRLIVSNGIHVSKMPTMESQGASTNGKHAIVLDATVTSEDNGHSNGKQRVGLSIKDFASDHDGASYFESVYSPPNLLNGEGSKLQPSPPEHIHN